MDDWSIHQLHTEAQKSLDNKSAASLKRYALNLKRSNLPIVFTLGHLSKIVNVDYKTLRATVSRRREYNNYRIYAIKKRSGGRRYIHALSKDLLKTHRFINSEILQKITPHTSSFAYHKDGGIRNCAHMHCGARWIFQYDLENFFYSINEANVYKVFLDAGYRSLLAFELARICTTLRLPKHLNNLLITSSYTGEEIYSFYQHELEVGGFSFSNLFPMGVLPQGSPSSPMLGNLVAKKLDEDLTKFADDNGFVYTRYADDITLSCSGDFDRSLSIGEINRKVISIIRMNKFKENRRKMRIAGPGSKKLVLGLLVDGSTPRLSRETYKRIDRHLYAIKKYGLEDVANHEGFDSSLGYYNHVAGLVSFVKAVDMNRWKEFSNRFNDIQSPLILT